AAAIADDADPARRTAAASAANAGVRDVEAPARLEDAETKRNAHAAPIRVGDANEPVPTLGKRADSAREEHEDDRGSPAVQNPFVYVDKPSASPGRALRPRL